MGSSDFILVKTENLIFSCFESNCYFVDKRSLFYLISYPLWIVSSIHLKLALKTFVSVVFRYI